MIVRLSLLFALVACWSLTSAGQAHQCGSRPTPAQIEVMGAMRNARAGFARSNDVIHLPVHHHIVRQSNGTSLVSNADLPGLIDELNAHFVEANVQFFTCGATNYINNSLYYDFDQYYEDALCEPNDIEDVINVYYVNSIVMSDGFQAGGFAYYPGRLRPRIHCQLECL